MRIRTLETVGLALWGLLIGPSLAGAFEPGESFRPAGEIRHRSAKEIVASNWSVGAETMDRDFTIYKHWKKYLGPLGAKKARIQSGWAKTETEPGKYNWEWLDEIVVDMVEQGVTPWVCICYGNLIYPGGGGTGLGGGLPWSPEALAAWDRYVAALVGRYKDRVCEWEIWNEPGLRKTEPPQTAETYADFFIRTAETVRSVQPKAKILGLSLPGIPLKFAEPVLARIKEQGKTGLLDELTYHPYKPNPDDSYEAVAKLRELLHRYAPKAIIRQGENGAPSMAGGFGAIAKFDWDEQSQAKWALRRLLGDLGRDIPSSYFSICDMCYPDRVNYKGLLAINPDKTVNHPKQSYHAVQHLTAVFDDQLQRVRDFSGHVQGGPEGATYAVFGYRNKQGAAVVTVWRSDKPPFEAQPASPVTVTLPGMTFTDPVLVDLLSGKVFAIPKGLWSQSAGAAVFERLPVWDSPVLVAERSALPLEK